MAWNSKEGELKKIGSDETYMSCILNCLNTTFGKTTSYKYGLIKSLLDNLFNVNNEYELDFKYILETFGKIYWNIITKYSLPQKQMSSQGKYSAIEKIIFEINDKYPSTRNVDFDIIDGKIKKEYFNRTKYLIYNKDVIGALYSDFECKIYGFSKKNKCVYFSKDSYDFLKENKMIIEKLNYYNWIIWVEKVLEKQELGINNVALKLDLSTKRKSLEYFKKRLFASDEKECNCFYCDKIIKIKSKQLHLDHFVPWSFAKDDKIWNLVPACSNCNLQKKDRIPTKRYLEKLLSRNKKILNNCYSTNINNMYDAAILNGFQVWNN